MGIHGRMSAIQMKHTAIIFCKLPPSINNHQQLLAEGLDIPTDLPLEFAQLAHCQLLLVPYPHTEYVY